MNNQIDKRAVLLKEINANTSILNKIKEKIISLDSQKIVLEKEVLEYGFKITSAKEKLDKLRPPDDCLIVTEHALKRFKERVIGINSISAKKILSNKILFDQYKLKGAGRFVHPTYENLIIVIKDYKIITVFMKDDYDEKFEILKLYMNHVIDIWPKKKPHFLQFRKNYYFELSRK